MGYPEITLKEHNYGLLKSLLKDNFRLKKSLFKLNYALLKSLLEDNYGLPKSLRREKLWAPEITLEDNHEASMNHSEKTIMGKLQNHS